MGKPLNIILKVIASLVALVILGVISLLFMVDPNQYKSVIQDAVKTNTGLELIIAGDLTLSYRPYIAVSLNDVRLRNPAKPQELASSTRISLRVDPMSLLQGELVIEELSADDFHVNWYVDAEGVSIWRTEVDDVTSEPSSTQTQSEADEEGSSLSANINLISIANANIDIQNLQQNYYYSIQRMTISSRNVNVENRPFSIESSFEFIDHTAPKPHPITFFSNSRINLESGEAVVDEFRLTLTPVQLRGSFEVENFNQAMSFSGELASNTFSLSDLLSNLVEDDPANALALPEINNQPSQQVNLKLSFSGDQSQAQVPDLQIELGETLIEAEASIRFANELSPTNISYEIRSNALNLNLYREVENNDTAEASVTGNNIATATTPGQLEDVFEIPRSLLSSLNVQGTISIDSLSYGDFRFDDLNLFTNLENGVLDIETQPITFLDGTVQGNVRINSLPEESELSVQFTLSDINVADLTLSLISLDAVTGKLNLEVDYTSQGNTVKQWLDNLSGSTSFAVTDNSVDIGVIKQVFTAIAALSPSGEAIEQWPDVLQFTDFSGYALFENGIQENQEIRVRLDNFDIAGTGGLNLDVGSFDYNFLLTILGEPYLQTIPISEQYHNVSWPVQCSASFTDEVSQFCRPDFPQVRELFIQLGTNQIQNRLEDVLTNQVPEELQDSARGLLRNLFQNL